MQGRQQQSTLGWRNPGRQVLLCESRLIRGRAGSVPATGAGNRGPEFSLDSLRFHQRKTGAWWLLPWQQLSGVSSFSFLCMDALPVFWYLQFLLPAHPDCGNMVGIHLHRVSFSRIPQYHILDQSIEGEMSSWIIQTSHSLEGIVHSPWAWVTA